MKAFSVLKKDTSTKARIGRIKTLHGEVVTPAFIPDATLGVVKHLSLQDLKTVNLQMVLGNIYHLWLRPGMNVLRKMEGLHKFMAWDGPIITDSGGFQVFSLIYKNKMGKVLENGVKFKDHLTGSLHFLTPKKSINMQLKLGSDILMVLDYPVMENCSLRDNKQSVKLTSLWAKDCYKYFLKNSKKSQILMAVIQGASSRLLRKQSFEELEKINSFPGYGFGGPPLNEKILDYTALLIPDNKIRYVMGGGTPQDIIKAVSMGWDLFDCVIPTRNARHGLLYSFKGELRISQTKYKLDKNPIEKDCPCLACQTYSRAYLRHLFKVKEPLALRLFSLHNLTFYMRRMKKIRQSIRKGSLKKFSERFLKNNFKV
jgi:queuine tRNA-ribosyltransferase